MSGARALHGVCDSWPRTHGNQAWTHRDDIGFWLLNVVVPEFWKERDPICTWPCRAVASQLALCSLRPHTGRQPQLFCVYRIGNSADGRFRQLYHGGILHGVQSLSPDADREPLAYYTRSGPAGAVFQAAQASMPHGNWAIVGLGAGAMACYVQPGQALTYYEIDPMVAQIASDTRYFTFLRQCALSARIVLGDARLKLREAHDGSYGLIVLDAFSGDSIPMHLMTREALTLYLRKLAPGGLLVFHISNLYFDLAPTLGNLAQDAHLDAVVANDIFVTQAQRDAGKMPSVWVVMAREPTDLNTLASGTDAPFRWEPLHSQPHSRLWTDDYSNLLGAIKLFAND